MSKLNKQDVAEHFAAERIVPTNEAEVSAQLWVHTSFDDSKKLIELEVETCTNCIPYVPASALAEVWEKAIGIATAMAAGETYGTGRQKALNIAAALETARDAALSAGKGATSEEVVG